MDLKEELDFCRGILVYGRADISRKKSKMCKKVGVGIGVMMETAVYNFGERRQKLFRGVLGVKTQTDKLEEQRDQNGWSQGARQRKRPLKLRPEVVQALVKVLESKGYIQGAFLKRNDVVFVTNWP